MVISGFSGGLSAPVDDILNKLKSAARTAFYPDRVGHCFLFPNIFQYKLNKSGEVIFVNFKNASDAAGLLQLDGFIYNGIRVEFLV